MIHAVPGMHDYVVTGIQPLQPPLSRKLTGRPKKLRRRQADEPRDPHKASRKNINVTCGKCLGSGHNKRTCKNRIHPNSTMLKVHYFPIYFVCISLPLLIYHYDFHY